MNEGEPPRGIRLWVLGARPRTLSAAVVPVVVGAAAAGRASPARTLGALVVALALQGGVNYANDYFDGVRGVDTTSRVGPVRLTASGLASPRAVATAAAVCFAVAGTVGLGVVWAAQAWPLLPIGAAAIAAAVLYSGGPRPYASRALGELAVFAFFGLTATAGTAYLNAGHVRAGVWWCAVAVGLIAVAILVANNIRDIATDEAVGKRTLAVRLGDARSRALYRALVLAALCVPVLGWLAGALPVGALLSLTAGPVVAGPIREVGRAAGPELVRILVTTSLLHLQFGAMLAIGLWLS